MLRILTVALLALQCQAATPSAKAAPLLAKASGKHVQLSAEQQKHMHWGCTNACRPSPVESKCVTACETAMYKCIDETGPNETPKDTDACQDKVLKLYDETKGLEKKEEKKEEKKGEKKEEKKKPKAFLQVRNIDDDNAEAAEMARLEAQSDKDMGEDDDETEKTDDSSDSSDDDSFVQVASKARKGDGFDGFGTPDPFNQNDDDQVDAGEPNAPDQENPNDDANMVSDDDADDDDSFIQVSRNIDDDNAEAAEMARLEAQSDKDMGEDDDETEKADDSSDDEESFVQVSRNIDDDNAEAAEMARLEAQSDKDMGEDDDETEKTDDDKESDDEE